MLPCQKLPAPVLPCLGRHHLPTSLVQLSTPRAGQRQAAPGDRSAFVDLTQDQNCGYSSHTFYLPGSFLQLFLPAFFLPLRLRISSCVVNLLLSGFLWYGGREKKENARGSCSFHTPCGLNTSVSTETFCPKSWDPRKEAELEPVE